MYVLEILKLITIGKVGDRDSHEEYTEIARGEKALKGDTNATRKET